MNKFLFVGVIFLLFAGTGGVMVYQKIRGIRNNNPLNIEKGAAWEGLSPVQSDSRFCVFVDAVYGIRAGARILMNYGKRGVNTVEKIISTWAPSVENNTDSYVNHVLRQTGFKRDQIITRNEYPALIAAMIKHENGVNPYSADTIERGVALA